MQRDQLTVIYFMVPVRTEETIELNRKIIDEQVTQLHTLFRDLLTGKHFPYSLSASSYVKYGVAGLVFDFQIDSITVNVIKIYKGKIICDLPLLFFDGVKNEIETYSKLLLTKEFIDEFNLDYLGHGRYSTLSKK